MSRNPQSQTEGRTEHRGRRRGTTGQEEIGEQGCRHMLDDIFVVVVSNDVIEIQNSPGLVRCDFNAEVGSRVCTHACDIYNMSVAY